MSPRLTPGGACVRTSLLFKSSHIPGASRPHLVPHLTHPWGAPTFDLRACQWRKRVSAGRDSRAGHQGAELLGHRTQLCVEHPRTACGFLAGGTSRMFCRLTPSAISAAGCLGIVVNVASPPDRSRRCSVETPVLPSSSYPGLPGAAQPGGLRGGQQEVACVRGEGTHPWPRVLEETACLLGTWDQRLGGALWKVVCPAPRTLGGQAAARKLSPLQSQCLTVNHASWCSTLGKALPLESG